MELCGTGGLEYSYDSIVWSLSAVPALDVLSPKEIISSLSLTRRTDTICILRHVKSGVQS